MKIYRESLAVFLILAAVLMSFGQLKGQKYPMINYTVSDGLPSSEIHCMLQDQEGYMWFGTDRGVARYDGYDFQIFTTDEGLPDNTVFEIHQDAMGRIWFATFSNLLCYYQAGTIHPYAFNAQIEALQLPANVKLSLSVGPDDAVMLGTLYHGMLAIDATGKIEILGTSRSTRVSWTGNSFGISYLRDLDDSCRHKHRIQAEQLPVFFLEMASGTWIEELGPKPTPTGPISAILARDSSVIVGMGQFLFHYKNGKRQATIEVEHQVCNLFLDENERLWICYKFGGLQVMDLRTMQFLPIRFPDFANYTISQVLVDHEGGLWITTTQQGAFYLPSLDFQYIPFPHGTRTKNVFGLACVNDSLAFVSSSSGQLYRISASSAAPWEMELIYDAEQAISITWDSLSETLVMAGLDFYYFHDGQFQIIRNAVNSGAKSLIQRQDGTYWAANRTGIFRIAGQDAQKIALDDSYPDCWYIFEDKDRAIWLGTVSGLRKYDQPNGTLSRPDHPALQKRVSAIGQLPDRRLVLGTIGGGIQLVDGDSVAQITQADGLSSNLVNCLAVDQKGRIWAGGGKGLNRITPAGTAPTKIVRLNLNHGLPMQEIQRMDIQGSRVWMAGPKGICVIDQEGWDCPQTPPIIHLKQVAVNGKDTLFAEELEVDYRHNYLRFSFIGLHYKTQVPLTYRYRLTGLDPTWRFTQDTAVSYPALPPGSYTFEVAARNASGEWSLKPASARINVSPAFWQTWWFLPLLILSLGSLGAAVATYFVRQSRRQLEREKDLGIWKMKALRARMDPHFTFNILNTIQAYISTHDNISAEKYLNKFARLVRKILHQSDAEAISLADEREMLDLYLTLEAMRFEGLFSYEIKIDPKLELETVRIPGMLVQPFVENAILHGLLPKNNNGKVTISFSAETKHLLCTIHDDGIGRLAASRLQRPGHAAHKSTGLDLVRSRLQLLHPAESIQDDIVITDLYHEDQTAAGTLVELFIPLMNAN